MAVRYATGWKSVLWVWNGANIEGICIMRYAKVSRNIEIAARKSRLTCARLSDYTPLTPPRLIIVKYNMVGRLLKVAQEVDSGIIARSDAEPFATTHVSRVAVTKTPETF